MTSDTITGAERAELCAQRTSLLAQLADPAASNLPVNEWMRLQQGALSLSKRIFLIDQAAQTTAAAPQ